MSIIGIDLGTTMSVIANIDRDKLGTPEVIANPDTGDQLTPSVIVFEDDTIEIGQQAKDDDVAYGDERLARLFKGQMEDENYRFEAKGVSYSATQLSSMILSYLTDLASQQVGKISDVVISVPARWGALERNATIEAGKQAGLNVLGIIDEPTAAGICFSTGQNIDGTVLVYDFGGGTFDVSIMEIETDRVDVLRTQGDVSLGGADFDKIMLEIMSERYQETCNGLLYDNKEDEYANLLQAEKFKKALSTQESIDRKVIGSEGQQSISISREEFEERTEELILRAEAKIAILLAEESKDKGIQPMKPEDVDTILLVGGSTRMPMVRKSIKKIFNQEPNVSVNVDTVVAEGAALKAAIIMSKNGEDVPAPIMNVSGAATRGYGIFSLDGGKDVNTIIIEKNSTLPCTETQYFSTTVDRQEFVYVDITEGESENRQDVKVIDSFKSHRLKPDMPAGQRLEITYSYDDNQIMHCSIKELSTGKETKYKTGKVS